MADDADASKPLYYAEDGIVWKRPIITPLTDGGCSIEIGFPVCRMHEAVGKDAAESVAELMNRGHAVCSKAAASERGSAPAFFSETAFVAGNRPIADVNWSAGRAAFLRYADRYLDATTSDVAAVTADVAPRAIAEAYLGRPLDDGWSYDIGAAPRDGRDVLFVNAEGFIVGRFVSKSDWGNPVVAALAGDQGYWQSKGSAGSIDGLIAWQALPDLRKHKSKAARLGEVTLHG